jgi:hypothetical protein
MKELDCEYMVDEKDRACRSTGKKTKENVAVQEHSSVMIKWESAQDPEVTWTRKSFLGKISSLRPASSSGKYKEHDRPNTYMPLQVVRWR